MTAPQKISSKSKNLTKEKKLKDIINSYKKMREEYLSSCRLEGSEPDPQLLEIGFNAGKAKTIKDAVFKSVPDSTPVEVQEIIERVERMGIKTSHIPIRSELSRLVKEGVLNRVGHGKYSRLT